MSGKEAGFGAAWSDGWRRVALVNPTKFLGNLLIGGGLIQDFADHCRLQGIDLLLVLDERFRSLVEDAFGDLQIVWYPRDQIARAGQVQAARLWYDCVKQIRSFRADLAFAIEEDSVCHQLTLFSGATHRVSSTRERHRFGFHQVLPVNRIERPPGQEHIWFSHAEVLQRLGVQTAAQPFYLRFPEVTGTSALPEMLVSPEPGRPLALLHAGATKPYKRWPLSHFQALAEKLSRQGYALALIGAGAVDREANASIMAACQKLGLQPMPQDLSDQLDLSQLGELMQKASLIVGNDSGPVHLAAALSVPGVVLFGPTDQRLWGPLSARVRVLAKPGLCAPDCQRRRCRLQWRCLSGITAEDVMASLPVSGG